MVSSPLLVVITHSTGCAKTFSPSELIRIGIADVNAVAQKAKQKFFKDLPPADRAALLSDVETGKAEMKNVPGPAWFNMFLQLTMEGYFGDPMYGGPRLRRSVHNSVRDASGAVEPAIPG